MLGVRVGGHQRERGEVVAGDPGGGLRVEHVGAVPQPQREPAAGVASADPQHGVLGEVAVPGRVDGSNSVSNDGPATPSSRRARPPRSRRAAAADSTRRCPQQRPPRAGSVVSGRAAAGPRPGDVAGHHVPLAGQRRQHLRVRGQQPPSAAAAPARRPAGAPPRGRLEGRDVLGDARHRVEGPPRDRGGPAREQDSPPELPAGFPIACPSNRPSVPRLAGCQPPRTSTAARCRRCDPPDLQVAERSRISLAGFPPHRACGGTSSPFMRKESAASTAPSPIVTP